MEAQVPIRIPDASAIGLGLALTLTLVYKDLSEKSQDAGIPDNWAAKVSKVKRTTDKAQGIEFIHPENESIRVRVMPGDPKARYPNSREPYVRQTIGKRSFDINGNLVKERSNEAHIPLRDYKFWEFWKNGKK